MVQLANGCIWNVTSIFTSFNQLKSSAKIYDKITKNNEDDSVYIQKEKGFYI